MSYAKIPYFAGVIVLLVASFFLIQPAFSLVTVNREIQSGGNISYPTPSSSNLAVIPDAWRWGYYGGVPEYVFVDYSVTHNGHPSLRLQKGGDIDPFGILDRSAWMNEPFGAAVKPGDHIVARCWIKIDPSSTGNTAHGARIGIDFWGGSQILTGYPRIIGDDVAWIHWGTSDWTMWQYDFIIPSTVFTTNQVGAPISPTQVTKIEMWAQVLPGNDNGNAWFSDAELYINP